MNIRRLVSNTTKGLAAQAVDTIVSSNLQKGPVLDHHRPQFGLSDRRSLIAYLLMSRIQRWQIDDDLPVRLAAGASENLVEHGLDMKDVAAEWFWDMNILNEELDLQHALELCDSHDIGETLPGDLPMGEVDSLKNKLRRMLHKKVERDFAESLLLPLLDPSGRLRQNYMEYEDRDSKADKQVEHLVKVIDCFVALRKALHFLYNPDKYSIEELPAVQAAAQAAWDSAFAHVELFLNVMEDAELEQYLLEEKFKQVFDQYQSKWPDLVYPY